MKTMLDVLIPLSRQLDAAGANPTSSLRRCAAEAAAATKPLQAIRGRASFLGERSKGHIDPGARSSQIMIEAVCDVVDGQT
jgi:dihydroxyacetone kinase-like protein